jgi:heat shock protein HslJ
MQSFRHLLPLVVALTVGACAATDPGTLALPGAINAPPPQIDLSGDALLTYTTWRWQGTLLPNGSSIVPDTPANYALDFQPGGRVTVRADCNRGSGSYLLNGAQLTFGPLALTKMMCPPGSRDREFLAALATTASQSFEGDDLVLKLAGNGGTMRFSSSKQ